MQETPGYVFADGDALLGRGRHCVVRLSTSTRYATPRKVAIKIATATPATTKEAEILFKLNHEHVVEIYDYFVVDANAHIVLALAEKGNLRSFVRRRGRLGEALAWRMSGQLFDAVAYLHDAVAVVHCDLKCENVLVDAREDVKVTDFGQAIDLGATTKVKSTGRNFAEDSLVSPSDSEDNELDTSSVGLTLGGSPAYAAPEVLDSKATDLRAADVWSAGIIAFYILTSYLPFGCHGNTSIRAAMDRPLRWPRPLKLIKKAQRTFVQSALTLTPSERPKSRELVDQLQALSRDE